MRYFVMAMALTATGLLSLPATAQPPEEAQQGGDRPDRTEFHERILEEFDEDKSGSLDEKERETMRTRFRERAERVRGERPSEADRERPEAGRRERERRDGERRDGERNRPEGDRPPRGEGRRGPGRGPGGPGGPGGPRGPMGMPPGPALDPLFNWFDGNSDGQLSREEFGALAEFVRRHAPRRPGGPPDGPRFGGRPDERPRGEFRRGEGRGPDGRPRAERERRSREGERRGGEGDAPESSDKPASDKPPVEEAV